MIPCSTATCLAQGSMLHWITLSSLGWVWPSCRHCAIPLEGGQLTGHQLVKLGSVHVC
jgi:hypothetical protein